MTRIMPTVYAALVLALCPQNELTLLWKAQADVAESRQFFEDAGASGETWGVLQAGGSTGWP
jgi:hypothetical protein